MDAPPPTLDGWKLVGDELRNDGGRSLDLATVHAVDTGSGRSNLLRLHGTHADGEPAKLELRTGQGSNRLRDHNLFAASVLGRIAELSPDLKVDDGPTSTSDMLRFLALLLTGGAVLAAGISTVSNGGALLIPLGLVLLAFAWPLRPSRDRSRSVTDAAADLWNRVS